MWLLRYCSLRLFSIILSRSNIRVSYVSQHYLLVDMSTDCITDHKMVPGEILIGTVLGVSMWPHPSLPAGIYAKGWATKSSLLKVGYSHFIVLATHSLQKKKKKEEVKHISWTRWEMAVIQLFIKTKDREQKTKLSIGTEANTVGYTCFQLRVAFVIYPFCVFLWLRIRL